MLLLGAITLRPPARFLQHSPEQLWIYLEGDPDRDSVFLGKVKSRQDARGLWVCDWR